ncbi:MAG: helix-turn-helix transcriptional regulator [Microscillaceae bacterium]|nr:helix-turn-helix transcriptional regulator [Microscillaceae bacterium]
MNIGDKVKLFIKSKGLTITNLARTMGKTPVSLSMLLKQESIGSKHLEEIAKALHVPLYMLFIPLEEEEEEEISSETLQDPQSEYGQSKDLIIKAQRKEIERLNKLVEDLKKAIR